MVGKRHIDHHSVVERIFNQNTESSESGSIEKISNQGFIPRKHTQKHRSSEIELNMKLKLTIIP